MVETKSYRRKHHFIYRTTCLVTGKYYIGMHSTNDLNDDYLGSGKRLRRSINKHGRQNHVREIMEMLSDRRLLREREREIVNVERLRDRACLNLTVGGNSAFDERTFEKISQTQLSTEVTEELRRKRSERAVKRELVKKQKGYRVSAIAGLKISAATKGKKKSEETKQKMSKAAKLREEKRRGWKHTDEAKQKIAAASKQRWNTEKSRGAK